MASSDAEGWWWWLQVEKKPSKELSLESQGEPTIIRTYIYQEIFGGSSSPAWWEQEGSVRVAGPGVTVAPMWGKIQFWEDVFFDAVAQERDLIGLDQVGTTVKGRRGGGGAVGVRSRVR